jgi:glycosyltransferase involved in cell wall biosynthesis
MKSLIAIPVFNEQTHLRRVLAEVRNHIPDLLVVDDGSTDATPYLLRRERGIYRIRHAENRGYGQSLRTAFSFAIRNGYDWLITMDCDEQHPPARIPAFLEAAHSTRADIISGSRYLVHYPDNGQPPPDRRAINARMTRLLNVVLGLNLTDAFCGFKAYKVSSLRKLRITIPGYAMPMQFWVQAVRAGLTITEIPVRLIYADPSRHFGGLLDNPDARWQHYLDVLIAELLDESYFEHLAELGVFGRSVPGLCLTSDC